MLFRLKTLFRKLRPIADPYMAPPMTAELAGPCIVMAFPTKVLDATTTLLVLKIATAPPVERQKTRIDP
jgi:hypothetical protein